MEFLIVLSMRNSYLLKMITNGEPLWPLLITVTNMGDTYKDKPEKYNKDPEDVKRRKPKEGKRFVSTKGRKNIKEQLKHNLEDYFI